MNIAGTTSVSLAEGYSDRYTLINNIKKAGKNYNFNKYTDAQLFRIWKRIQAQEQKPVKKPAHEFDLDFDIIPSPNFEYCDFCGTRLTDLNQCPICDLGEEDFV
jgi:rubrerythrin